MMNFDYAGETQGSEKQQSLDISTKVKYTAMYNNMLMTTCQTHEPYHMRCGVSHMRSRKLFGTMDFSFWRYPVRWPALQNG